MGGEFDITAVFTAIADFFAGCYTFLNAYYITVFNYSVSLFQLACGVILTGVFLSALIPWYNEVDDDD